MSDDGVGARLLAARERLGLTPVQAAERLRLEPQSIEAMDAGQFEKLGASVHVRGHLRRYAELVGENALELEQLYARRPGAMQPPDVARTTLRQPALPAPQTRRIGLWPALLVAAVLTLGALAWWAMRSQDTASGTETFHLGGAGTP